MMFVGMGGTYVCSLGRQLVITTIGGMGGGASVSCSFGRLSLLPTVGGGGGGTKRK